MKKALVFIASMLPINIKKDGTVRFSFGNLALQGMTVILVFGIYVKWFTLRNIESADILGIAGLVFGTGYLTNQHKKIESERESMRPEAEDKP